MRPVLKYSEAGEVRIRNVVDTLADEFELTDEERGATSEREASDSR